MASKDKMQSEKKDDSVKAEIVHRLKRNPLLFGGTLIVLIIVIISFVLVPAIVPSGQRGEELIFGYYNRVPIKYVPNNYFSQALQMLAQNQRSSQDDPESISSANRIWRQAFEETAVHTGILEEMKQAGFIVPASVVDRRMAELPYFQENGRFSSTKYRSMDNNARMNLWRQVQESIVINAYMSDVESLKTASKEVSFVASMASPQRSFDLAIFSLNSYPDSEVTKYVEANQNLFQYIRLSMITSGSERESRQLLESIKNGAITFEDAARAHSTDWASERGGDMGEWMAVNLVYAIGDSQAREAVLKLGTGELSDVYKLSAGWCFFRVNETAYPVNLAEPGQLQQIKQHVMQNERGRVEDWAISEAESFHTLVEASSFYEAAIAKKTITRRLGPISLNYGNSTLFSSLSSAGIPELENAGKDQFFWRAAFNTPINSLSKPIVVNDSVIVLLPTEENFLDETETGYIESFYPYLILTNTEFTSRLYFLNNEKLDDRFQETFSKLWGVD